MQSTNLLEVALGVGLALQVLRLALRLLLAVLGRLVDLGREVLRTRGETPSGSSGAREDPSDANLLTTSMHL